jgi:stringent starvation protein B
LDNDWISFQARFGGVPRKIMVPVSHVLAIYARENGQGMSFPFNASQTNKFKDISQENAEKPKASRPSLTIVK